MTFYWWSHWFWITTLSTILLSIANVDTYPSQEISLQYNHDSKTLKAITKVYQTTRTWEWSTTTTTPPSQNTNEIIKVDKTTLLRSPKDQTGELTEAEDIPTSAEQATSEATREILTQRKNASTERRNAKIWEHKRSADIFNETEESAKSGDELVEEPQTAAVVVAEQPSADGVAMLKPVDTEITNYTNYSRAPVQLIVNANCNNCNTPTDNTTTMPMPIYTAQPPKSVNTTATKATLIAMDRARLEALEWLNEMAAAAALPLTPPSTNIPRSTESDREFISATTTVAPFQQRIPFTLENANKEEELRRAESEHRSRKSKVLSAEYKHINRFINYSADTKSLLARSASTSPNDFNDAEESNISSEALAIQRTYFLDAGAISAICFTIFGVCCTVSTIGVVLYRRRYLNKPQALSEPDSSVYIDDSTMRDNSDEMYSLDNDSFLNSLEAMTIQNYWTDTVKHTKL